MAAFRSYNLLSIISLPFSTEKYFSRFILAPPFCSGFQHNTIPLSSGISIQQNHQKPFLLSEIFDNKKTDNEFFFLTISYPNFPLTVYTFFNHPYQLEVVEHTYWKFQNPVPVSESYFLFISPPITGRNSISVVYDTVIDLICPAAVQC